MIRLTKRKQYDMIWLPFFALFLETLRLDEIRLGWRDDDDGDSDDDGTMVEE